jgi:hypothetical protein
VTITKDSSNTVQITAQATYTLTLLLYWQLDAAPPDQNYTVFIHGLDKAGHLSWQQDNPLVRGQYPTSLCEVGDTVIDPYDIPLNNLGPGRCLITNGLYLAATGVRLPLRNANTTLAGENQLVLAALDVQP